MRPVGTFFRAAAWLIALAWALSPWIAAADEVNEYQVKAVFLFNFSHFVEWPSGSLGNPTDPFVVGVLGEDPFGARLDEAVRNERVGEHPILVRRFHDVGDVAHCQLLFIDRSQGRKLAQIVGALGSVATLTVAETDGAAAEGVMVEFVTDKNHIRLRINERAARAAGLVISSKLLRLADVVGNGHGD
jgi:hypothetical protein